jgi:uncharacterized membrane protein
MSTQERRPRGRPRPNETLLRDRLILDCLTEHGPATRNQLAEGLGLDKTKTYLALSRLRAAGLIRKCVDKTTNAVVWSADAEEPCA